LLPNFQATSAGVTPTKILLRITLNFNQPPINSNPCVSVIVATFSYLFLQWDNGNNVNSNSLNSNPGDTIYGNVTFLGESEQAYRLCQTDLTTGQSSCQRVDVEQNNNGGYKNYSIAYFVFEKPANCQDYPPDNQESAAFLVQAFLFYFRFSFSYSFLSATNCHQRR
jgi:hypothetical protein